MVESYCVVGDKTGRQVYEMSLNKSFLQLTHFVFLMKFVCLFMRSCTIIIYTVLMEVTGKTLFNTKYFKNYLFPPLTNRPKCIHFY